MLCRVLLSFYEKDAVDNILYFLLYVVQAVPKCSEVARQKVFAMYPTILVAFM